MRIFESPSTAEDTSKAPLRIFHFLYDHTGNPWVGGGGAVRAREIYKRIAPSHDVTVISGSYPGAGEYEEEGVKYRFVGTGKDSFVASVFSYAYRAACFLRDHSRDADVVVEDFAPYNPVFSYRIRRDAVLQLHQKEGFHILRKYLLLGLPFYLVERYYPHAFRNVTVVSEQSRVKYGLGARARVIPNGFDEGFLSEAVSDGGYLLFMGRLELDSKGLDILFKALAEIDGMHLKIAGKGKDESKVRRLASDAGANRVEMLGYVTGEDKINLFKDCSALVLPSRFEGNPLAALEAAAFAKPVVVSDIPELRYAVDAGFGVSFRTGDATDLADKIKDLMAYAALRAGMGAKARQYAKDFTWGSIARRYESFLLEVWNSRE